MEPGALIVHLGDTDVCLVPPEDRDLRVAVSDALSVLRQRVVGEEEVSDAIKVFDDASSTYPGAFLCLSEAYLSGASPEHGVNHNLAARSLISYLEAVEMVSTTPRNRGSGEAATQLIANSIASMNVEALAPHAVTLLRLSRRCPALRGPALCAHLTSQCSSSGVVRMLEDAGSNSEATTQDALEALQGLLASLAVADKDRGKLRHQIYVGGEQVAVLENALCETRGRSNHFESTSQQLVAQLERNEALIAGMQDELHIKAQDEARLRDIAASSEEIAMECCRLGRSLEQQNVRCQELEARNNALQEILRSQHQQRQKDQSDHQHMQQMQQHRLQEMQETLHQATNFMEEQAAVNSEFAVPGQTLDETELSDASRLFHHDEAMMRRSSTDSFPDGRRVPAPEGCSWSEVKPTNDDWDIRDSLRKQWQRQCDAEADMLQALSSLSSELGTPRRSSRTASKVAQQPNSRSPRSGHAVRYQRVAA